MDTKRTVAVRSSRFAARGSSVGWVLVGALVVGFAVALTAQSLPRLPGPLTMARSADSPGQVMFNHETHVDQAKPMCTNCHPREFPILKVDTGKRTIRHSEMEKGRQCGACHDGKKAFGLADDCTACHRS